MAQGPTASGAFDDGVRVDENAIEVEEERCTTDLHDP